MIQKIIKNTLKRFENENNLLSSLTHTDRYYRPYDPGSYLYKKLMEHGTNDKFTDEFIELIYVTLSAWNMNSRGAKLEAFETFKKSITNNKSKILSLDNVFIENISEKDFSLLKQLFIDLKLTAHKKPKLITFSKTLHFLLPNLVVPIDRKYTLNFFYGNTNIPKNDDRQFEIYKTIQLEYSKYSKMFDLNKYQTGIWNKNHTKIMDNMVIGYLLSKKK
jgi:hypothetical protein